MKTAIGIMATAICTLAGTTAHAQWPTPIQDWPAHYMEGPFIFLLKAGEETRAHECMPPMRRLATAARDEMARHELEVAENTEDAKVFFVVSIIATKAGSRCTVVTRPKTITEIRVEHAGSMSVEIGEGNMELIFGSQSDTARMAEDAIRDFIAEAGRGILITRLRRARGR